MGKVAPDGVGGGISNLGGEGARLLDDDVRWAIDMRFVEATRVDIGRIMGEGGRRGPLGDALRVETGVAVGRGMKCEGEGGRLGRVGRTLRGRVKAGRVPRRGGM